MFDNLRQQLNDSGDEAPRTPRSLGGNFLGMTPSQLFILALMLFLNVTVLGCFALVAFDKVALPF